MLQLMKLADDEFQIESVIFKKGDAFQTLDADGQWHTVGFIMTPTDGREALDKVRKELFKANRVIRDGLKNPILYSYPWLPAPGSDIHEMS